MCKKHTVPIDKNNNLGQSKSLPTMCILPLRRRRFAYFECTSHTLIHLFYIHARHQMIEAARRDNNDVLQRAMVSQLGHLLRVVTSASHGSLNQPISFWIETRLYAWQTWSAPRGEEVSSASAIRVPCVLKRAYRTRIPSLSVDLPCASQKVVKWMIWAVHKTGSRTFACTE